MASVPDQLRQARMDRNLTVEQVAEITKLRTDHVRALEEGNYAFFAAPVYIRGFVRSYASLVKLDVPEVMAALELEIGQDKRLSEMGATPEQTQGAIDAAMLHLSKLDLRKGLVVGAALAGLVILVIGWLIWRHHETADPLQGLQPGVYQSTQHVSGDTLPLPAPTPAPRR